MNNFEASSNPILFPIPNENPLILLLDWGPVFDMINEANSDYGMTSSLINTLGFLLLHFKL